MQDGGAGAAYEETQDYTRDSEEHVERYIGTQLRYIIALLSSLGPPYEYTLYIVIISSSLDAR